MKLLATSIIFMAIGIGCGMEATKVQRVEGDAEIKAVFEDKTVQGCFDLFGEDKITYNQFEKCLELTTSREIILGGEISEDLKDQIREATEKAGN